MTITIPDKYFKFAIKKGFIKKLCEFNGKRHGWYKEHPCFCPYVYTRGDWTGNEITSEK